MRRIAGAVALVLLVLAALGAAAGAPAARAASIELAKPHPTRGETILVRLEGVEHPDEWVLEAIERPESATARTETLGPFGLDGTFRWTPETPGLTTLTAVGAADGARGATRNVAVRFDRTPALGILIFLGAGLLLFGGTTTMLRRSLEG